MKSLKVLAVLAFFYLGSCVSMGGLGKPATMKRQHAVTVKIVNTCMRTDGSFYQAGGSGAAIGPKHVLTAHHVVECETDVQSITVELPDGQMYLMLPDVASSSADIARLRMDPVEGDATFKNYVTQYAKAPDEGEMICFESALPGRHRKCGWVQAHESKENGDIRHSIVSEPGNSGSIAYDEEGRVVGVVTMLYWCPNLFYVQTRQVCGGLVSSIWKHREMFVY